MAKQRVSFKKEDYSGLGFHGLSGWIKCDPEPERQQFRLEKANFFKTSGLLGRPLKKNDFNLRKQFQQRRS